LSDLHGLDERWVAADPDDLTWVHWPDGAAVFHRPSGKTHFLNPASVLLLDQLARRSLTSREAGLWLAQHQRAQADAGYLVQVQSILFRFGQLGLAKCLRC
jgi:PqqD family protein of HPr-rel-A system